MNEHEIRIVREFGELAADDLPSRFAVAWNAEGQPYIFAANVAGFLARTLADLYRQGRSRADHEARERALNYAEAALAAKLTEPVPVESRPVVPETVREFGRLRIKPSPSDGPRPRRAPAPRPSPAPAPGPTVPGLFGPAPSPNG